MMPLAVAVMVKGPDRVDAVTSVMAWRKLPMPVSSVLVTEKTWACVVVIRPTVRLIRSQRKR